MWTNVATTFFVLVMDTTAPGSVLTLYKNATAASFSSGARRSAAALMALSTVSLERSVLLDESLDKFCKVRRAETRSSGRLESEAVTKASTSFGNRVIMLALDGNRVRLDRISKALVRMGLSVCWATANEFSNRHELEHKRCWR